MLAVVAILCLTTLTTFYNRQSLFSPDPDKIQEVYYVPAEEFPQLVRTKWDLGVHSMNRQVPKADPCG